MPAIVDLAAIALLCANPRAPLAGAREAPAFLAITAEIAKLDSVHGADVDWSAVRDHAVAALRTSHDLLAACYLGHALHRSHGLPGLAAGLAVLSDLLGPGWESLPATDRPRARAAAMQWFAERSTRLLADGGHEPSAIAECERLASPLAEACRRRFAGSDAGVAGLVRALHASTPEDTVEVVPAPDVNGAAIPQAKDHADGARSQPGVGTRAAAVRRLAEAADYFQRCEPHSPIGPLLQRAVSWSAKSFTEVFAELLARSPEARAGMWQVLGLQTEDDR